MTGHDADRGKDQRILLLSRPTLLLLNEQFVHHLLTHSSLDLGIGFQINQLLRFFTHTHPTQRTFR